jgi:hypothetical protein
MRIVCVQRGRLAVVDLDQPLGLAIQSLELARRDTRANVVYVAENPPVRGYGLPSDLFEHLLSDARAVFGPDALDDLTRATEGPKHVGTR